MYRHSWLVGALSVVVCWGAVTPAQTTTEKLLMALRNAEAQAVRACLIDAKAANVADEDGVTALMYAALYADADTLKQLLARGAQVNAQSKAGLTALLLALGDAEKVKVLLAHGAEPNLRTPQGHTALELAAGRAGAVAVVRLLLEHKADLAQGNVMAAAARNGDVEILKLLLAHGADPNNKNKLSGQPAASTKRAELNRNDGLPRSPFLLTPSMPVGEGTPLMYAAYARNHAAVRFLLEHGADVNARNNGNSTALMLAAQMGDLAIVKTLLAHGAEVNAQNVYGYSALLYAVAAEGNEPALLKALLAKDASIHLKAKDGLTPLALASRKGKTETVRLLTQAGATE